MPKFESWGAYLGSLITFAYSVEEARCSFALQINDSENLNKVLNRMQPRVGLQQPF